MPTYARPGQMHYLTSQVPVGTVMSRSSGSVRVLIEPF